MSNPNASFYQFPKTGTFSYQPFAVGADYKFPDYFNSVFKPATEAQQQARGTNTTSGGRNQPAFDYNSTGSAVPGFDPTVTQWTQIFDAMQQSNLERQIKAAQVSQDLSLQGMTAYYPILSQAAREATERNLLASRDWEDFKARLPAYQQNIAASQQAQAASAGSTEANLMNALANLKNAQKRMTYRGSTFAVG
jgi:hypothetical protein